MVLESSVLSMWRAWRSRADRRAFALWTDELFSREPAKDDRDGFNRAPAPLDYPDAVVRRLTKPYEAPVNSVATPPVGAP